MFRGRNRINRRFSSCSIHKAIRRIQAVHRPQDRNRVRNASLLTIYPMRIPARLLAIALLAIGLYLPAQIFTRAQQTGTITVRPRVATPLVTVDRNRVPLGALVTFSLTPAGVALYSRV